MVSVASNDLSGMSRRIEDELVGRDADGNVYEVSHKVYLDRSIYDRELETIFGRQWVFVGLELEIPEPGNFKTTFIGEIPVIVVRDNDGRIRVYENVCLHRGAKLLRKPCGSVRAMTCMYHRWSFGLDGSLLSVGLPKGFPADFRKEDYKLSEVPRVETFSGMIFASYDSAIAPLDQYLGGMGDHARAILNDGKVEFLGFQRYHVKANWKLFVENTIDAYHPGLLHVAIMRDRTGVRWTDAAGANHKFANGHGLLQWPVSVVEPSEWQAQTDLPTSLGMTRKDGLNNVSNVFPNVMILQIEDILTIRQLIPRGPDQVDVIAYNLCLEGDSEEVKQHRAWVVTGQFGIAGVASLDDKIAMESVQDAAKAKYDRTILLRGDLSAEVGDPTAEISLRGFYEQWADCVGRGAS